MKFLLNILLIGALSFANAMDKGMIRRAHFGPFEKPPAEYDMVLNSLNGILKNYTNFISELDMRIEIHKHKQRMISHPMPDRDVEKPADLYDEKLVNLCKAMKVGLTNVIDDVKNKYHSRYCEKIIRIRSTGKYNEKNKHIVTLKKFYAASLETLHDEIAGLPQLSLEIVDEKRGKLNTEACIKEGLAELKTNILDKLEHLCDQFYAVLQAEKEMNFADHKDILQEWSEEIKNGSLQEKESKQSQHLSGIVDMLENYQTQETYKTIKNYIGKEVVVQEEYQDEDFKLSKGDKVFISHVDTKLLHRLRWNKFNIFKDKIVEITKHNGKRKKANVPAKIFSPWEKSSLWQICQQICGLVLKDDATVANSKYEIRPVPKKGARMFTKGVRKYGMDFSKVTDSFGCTIITGNFNEQIRMLTKVFDSFNGDGQLFTVNNNQWRIQLQKVKLDLSAVAAKARDFEVRHAYVDDKVIFHATLISKKGIPISPKKREILRLETIILPKKIKDLKDESHKVYDQVRELGRLITKQTERFCGEYVMDKMYADLKSDLANQRFRSGLKVFYDGKVHDFEEHAEQCEREYLKAKQHGIVHKHKRGNSENIVHEHKHFLSTRAESVRESVAGVTSEQFKRDIERFENLVPAIQQIAMFNANKDDIARSKYVNSMFYLCRQMYKKLDRSSNKYSRLLGLAPIRE